MLVRPLKIAETRFNDLTAYVLDLRDRFPVKGQPREELWRERALKLEEDLEIMKTKLQKQEIGTNALVECIQIYHISRTTQARHSISSCTTTFFTATLFVFHMCAAQKEGKEDENEECGGNTATYHERPPDNRFSLHFQLRVALVHRYDGSRERLHAYRLNVLGQYYPPSRGSLDVLGALSSFTRELSSKPSRQKATSDLREITLPNARRVLHAFSGALKLAMSAKTSSPAIEDLATIFSSLLSTLEGLPLSTQAFTDLTPDFVTFVITPIMRSIISISVTMISRAVTTSTKAKSTNAKSSNSSPSRDIRVILLDMLRQYFALLASLKVPTRAIVEATVLDFTHEITRIFTLSTSSATSAAPAQGASSSTSIGVIDGNSVALSRQQRIRRLADKDSFWYLCAICHSALDSLPAETPRAEGNVESLTSNAVMDGLSDIAAKVFKHESGCGRGLGEVESELLLAVLEKAWVRNLVVGCDAKATEP